METLFENTLLSSWLRTLGEATAFDVATLESAVSNVPLSLADVQQYVRFDVAHYTRSLIFESDRFQVLCLGWLPGQGSPVHSHGASVCVVRILQGLATERLFKTIEETVPTKTRHWSVGNVAVSDGKLIHSITNETVHPLVTLHVYSPPLVRMTPVNAIQK